MYIMLRASPRQLAAICSLLTTGYIVICISGIVTRVYVLLGRVTTHGGSHHHRNVPMFSLHLTVAADIYIYIYIEREREGEISPRKLAAARALAEAEGRARAWGQ